MDGGIDMMEIDGKVYQKSVENETILERIKGYQSSNASVVDPRVMLQFVQALEAMFQNHHLCLVDTESQRSFELLFAEIASLKKKVVVRENEIDEFWTQVSSSKFELFKYHWVECKVYEFIYIAYTFQ